MREFKRHAPLRNRAQVSTFVLDPTHFSECEQEPGCNQNERADNDEVTVGRAQFRHVLEVHPVDSGDERQWKKYD
jgi:hypothetical protein